MKERRSFIDVLIDMYGYLRIDFTQEEKTSGNPVFSATSLATTSDTYQYLPSYVNSKKREARTKLALGLKFLL